jgi:hypothetical protein
MKLTKVKLNFTVPLGRFVKLNFPFSSVVVLYVVLAHIPIHRLQADLSYSLPYLRLNFVRKAPLKTLIVGYNFFIKNDCIVLKQDLEEGH